MAEGYGKGVMDTPEKTKNTQIATSLRRFEDSPVSNFMNNLSPIKPVKSMPITQTINPLTYASIQSVFTSPHATSLKECRFIRRNQLSDPSRPDFSSDEWNTVNEEGEANADADNNKLDDDCEENLDQSAPTNREVSHEPSYEECSEIIAELSRNPEHATHSYHTSEGNMEGVGRINQSKGTTETLGDWDNLVSGPSSSSVDPATSFYTSIKHAIQNTLSSGPMVSGNLFSQPGEQREMLESNETLGVNRGSLTANSCENMDYQHLSGLYRGVRRRCLVFDKSGGRAQHLADNSTSDSCIPDNDSSQCVLPGIGLHLNALAPTPNDYNIANNDSSFSRGLMIGPGPFPNFHHPPTCSGQELLGTTLTDYSLAREIGNIENGVARVEDSYRESVYAENEEINPSSPKKKRRRVEQAGDGDGSCKRCNCKKSKCLKLYCECFAAGVYCVEPCACIDCFNKPVHEDIVLSTRKQIESRNPLAFAPKVIRGSKSSPVVGDDSSKTPASARHKRGCNCKKSGCLKKYCECYQGGVGCSINCRCEGCKNAFGTKDGGSCALSMNHEFEEDETYTTEKAELNTSFRKATIQDNPMRSAFTETPSRTGRQLSQSSSSSKKRSSASSLPSSSSSSFPASQGFGKSSFLQPTPKFSHHPEPIEEDEMPEFLLEGSPNSGGNQLPSSPNGKRVLPPQSSQERSPGPGHRSSRKLILQSIPSFPSLMHNH